ncbi:MAG: phosphatidate cytidylyltransferase [Clostridiales bacterium]|jgi:phosphatidate cytidylyltransferase|nr:phosphatidate cytidylyltransferase [Clostridiales bacterium]
MVKRVLTSLIGAPVLAVVLFFGGMPLAVAVLLLSAIGLFEFYRAAKVSYEKINFVGYFFAILYVGLAYFDMAENFTFPIAVLFILVLFCIVVILYDKVSVTDCAKVFLGFMYIAGLFSCVIFVRNSENGIYNVWIIFLAAFGSDTGAYITGKLFGKRKLAPNLSPKKTVEGSIGGIILAGAASAVLGVIFYKLGFIDSTDVMFFAIVGTIGGAFSQIGDLAASAIKRRSGIKDFGDILPGHGGVLDRFDSVLFVAPLVYISLKVLSQF